MIFPFNAGEVFKLALQLEDNGFRFYEAAAAKPFPAEIKALFQHLALEEKGHKAVFTHILSQVPAAAAAATVWDPDNELDQYLKMMADQHVFNQAPAELDRKCAGLADFREAVRLAMSFEKDSIVFFLELLALSENNEEGRAEIRKLVDEERKHLRKLTRLLK